MSLTLTSPFYSLADFDRLFDEAFNARTSLTRRDGGSGQAVSHMRPRYVLLFYYRVRP